MITVTYQPHQYGRLSAAPFNGRSLNIVLNVLIVQVRTTETEVFVATAQKQLHEERFVVCKELWDADIKVSGRFL